MNRLERATHVSLILTCVVALFFMYDARRTRIATDAAHSRPMRITRSPNLVGTKMTLVGVNWSQSPLNVVIVLSPNCQFCVASLPFYRRLTSQQKASGARPSITAVSADAAEATQDWLSRENVTVDHLLNARLSEVGVHGTPAVLLVDAEGMVKKVYDGKLSANNEEELLGYIGSSPGN